jgi:hypothetical protein
MVFRAILAAFLVATMASCDVKGSRTPDARTPTPTVSPTAAERTPSVELPKIDNRASGKARGRVVKAIRDLKTTPYWDRLTKHLYVVSIGSRPGRQYVPDDGHLAEARAFPFADDDGGGRLCDITFFPTAIDDDRRLQAHYFEQGLLDRGPATLRDFWASILGHELAHCLVRKENGLPALTPEPVAKRWEKKVLAALEGKKKN